MRRLHLFAYYFSVPARLTMLAFITKHRAQSKLSASYVREYKMATIKTKGQTQQQPPKGSWSYILCFILLQLVFDAVNECLPGSFNYILGDADRAPHRAFVPRFDYYPHACGGARPGIYYADLIIDQMDILDTRVEIIQRLSQSGIKRVDRAVALADNVLGFVADPEFDGRLGDNVTRRAFLNRHVIFDQVEKRLVRTHGLLDEQVEAGVGGLELVAFVLKLLNAKQYLSGQLLILGNLCLFKLGQYIGLAAQFGDQKPPLVADQLGRDMLVAALALAQGIDVQSRLVGEYGQEPVELAIDPEMIGYIAPVSLEAAVHVVDLDARERARDAVEELRRQPLRQRVLPLLLPFFRSGKRLPLVFSLSQVCP